MARRRSFAVYNIQAELERNLLVRPRIIDQRDRRRKCFKIQEVQRVNKPVQKCRDEATINMWGAGERDSPLNLLVFGEAVFIGNLRKPGRALLQELESFRLPAIKLGDVPIGQEFPAMIMQRARTPAMYLDFGRKEV